MEEPGAKPNSLASKPQFLSSSTQDFDALIKGESLDAKEKHILFLPYSN